MQLMISLLTGTVDVDICAISVLLQNLCCSSLSVATSQSLWKKHASSYCLYQLWLVLLCFRVLRHDISVSQLRDWNQNFLNFYPLQMVSQMVGLSSEAPSTATARAVRTSRASISSSRWRTTPPWTLMTAAPRDPTLLTLTQHATAPKRKSPVLRPLPPQTVIDLWFVAWLSHSALGCRIKRAPRRSWTAPALLRAPKRRWASPWRWTPARRRSQRRRAWRTVSAELSLEERPSLWSSVCSLLTPLPPLSPPLCVFLESLLMLSAEPVLLTY